jgi:hypothetical protein
MLTQQTERTHEENQERAYIAASRRSDRSLEARVESARRASEIHKRRTGRSLKVTEQIVIDEEMYDEEDDDLPVQYRRLTAHLQTDSVDFNRRLSAYLTNHVAMRTALEQFIDQSFAQQSPAQSALANGSGQLYSHMTPNTLPNQNASAEDRQRLATPQQQSDNGTSQDKFSASAKQKVSSIGRRSMPPSFPKGFFANSASNATALATPSSSARSSNDPTVNPSMLPLTTGLPPESQQFLAGHISGSDFSADMLMAGANALPQFWSNPAPVSGAGGMSKLNTAGGQLFPTFEGLNSTLSPAQDLPMPAYSSPNGTPPDAARGAPDTALSTPSGESWNCFINDDKWGLPPTSSQ